MTKKTTLFLTIDSVDFVNSHKRSYDQTPPFSRSVNTAITQLRFVLINSIPELTNGQWTLIIASFNGFAEGDQYYYESSQDIIDRIKLEFESGYDHCGFTPGDADFEAIANLSAAETIVVYEVAMRFWSRDTYQDQMIKDIGEDTTHKQQAEWLARNI